jgi:hypothetical protein
MKDNEWMSFIMKNVIEPTGMERFFPDPKSLGPWIVNDEFVINDPILPGEISADSHECSTDNLYPTHPFQSTKEYLHAVYSMYDHATLSPDSYACLTKNPTGKYCLRGAVALMVVMSDTYEDDCGNLLRGHWLVTYLQSDENMGTLFSKGRVLYENPHSEFPGEYEEGGTYVVKKSDFFLLGDLLKDDPEKIRMEREHAVRAGFRKQGKLFIK